MFFWREQLPPTRTIFGVDLAITDRWGGVSQGTHGELNLGDHVGDDPAAVATNRARLATELGVEAGDLRLMDQQHGCAVALTPGTGGEPLADDDQPRRSAARPGPVAVPEPAAAPGLAPPADALVSSRPGEVLLALVADCVPVLVLDRAVGLVAAVHAGRPGMTSGVVPAAMRTLRELGAQPRSLRAIVGPSVCARCYEVPPAMRDEAAAVSPVSASVSWTGTPAVDVAAGVVDQLRAADVEVRWLPGCTRESPGLFSYRRDGTTGRFAGAVRLLAPEEVA